MRGGTRGSDSRLTVYTNMFKRLVGYRVNPLTVKLFNLNFHPLEFVSRSRDPQLQVSENYPDLTK